MAIYSLEEGTPGILVNPKGKRKNFRTKQALRFPEDATSGPFEGLYIFQRDDFLLYIKPEHVQIDPDPEDCLDSEEGEG